MELVFHFWSSALALLSGSLHAYSLSVSRVFNPESLLPSTIRQDYSLFGDGDNQNTIRKAKAKPAID